MSIKSRLSKELAPRVTNLAPGLTNAFVREALNRAIRGVGPLPPAAAAAEKQLREQHGDTDRGIHEVIENHVRMAGLQGFVTNLGGLVTAPMTIPANITGLALLQCRMIAGIVHLRGYDLDDPRVRNAILVTLLGEATVNAMVKKKDLPGPPMALAFLANLCAARGRPLKRGQLVTTGAASGIHDIRAGETARIVFADLDEIHCIAQPARPFGDD